MTRRCGIVRASVLPMHSRRYQAVRLSGTSRRQFLDLAGDGQLDLVDLRPSLALRTNRRPMGTVPRLSVRAQCRWDEPNLRFIDLTGDGHADSLSGPRTSSSGMSRWPKTASVRHRPSTCPLDEEHGPRIVFADRPIDLPRRHVRRRPDRHRADPQWRGLLLAQPRLRPVRRQGDHGRPPWFAARISSTRDGSAWPISTVRARPT